ncbi:hypothetical protein ISF74_07830 [Burkholderia pseudomallei]|nr:hypothetical protein [Burkholderia pseudomallei]
MNKLDKLYHFLAANHHWNETFQTDEYKKCLTHCSTAKQRLIALLHMVAHTQSEPRLESLAEFWRHLEAAPWTHRAPSLLELTVYIEKAGSPYANSAGPWDRIFHALNNIDGWGPKTAALFVKCIIGLHRASRGDLYCLQDIEIAHSLNDSDRLYLPVDAVIRRVFEACQLPRMGKSFYPINATLFRAGYKAEQMLVWDDLWFWGFFTQNSSGEDRSLGWNEARFWGQLSTPKSDVKTIRTLCEKFLKIIMA